MPPGTRRTVAAFTAILVGLTIVAGGLSAASTAAQPDYQHTVELAEDDERVQRVADDSSVRAVYDFQTLSADAQDAFLAALAAPDGEATVRTAAPEFDYGDTGSLGEGEFYVRYDSKTYVVRTGGEQSAAWVDAVPPLLLGLFVGGSALLAGALSLLGWNPRLSATAFVGTAAPAAGVDFEVFSALSGPFLGGFALVVVTGVVAAGLAWYGLGWLWRED